MQTCLDALGHLSSLHHVFLSFLSLLGLLLRLLLGLDSLVVDFLLILQALQLGLLRGKVHLMLGNSGLSLDLGFESLDLCIHHVNLLLEVITLSLMRDF